MQKSSSGAWRLWIPVGLYTALIFWLSSAPRPIPPALRFPNVDKLLHILEYWPLGLLALRASGGSFEKWPLWKIHLFAILWVLCTAAADEFYQRFTPMRISSAWDAAADGIGGIIGQIVWRIRLALNRKAG